mgnify:CR=1 FL=1
MILAPSADVEKKKNINLNVALKVGQLIQNNCNDVKVIYTRKTDVFIPLDRRAQIANNAKADLFISIHTNSVARSRTVRGAETYTLGLHRTEENLEVAKNMAIKPENIAIIDNGEILSFKSGKLEDYRDTIEVEDVMIDGIGVGDVGDKVIDDRIQLSNDGVVIIGVTIDSKTHEIIANTDIESKLTPEIGFEVNILPNAFQHFA